MEKLYGLVEGWCVFLYKQDSAYGVDNPSEK